MKILMFMILFLVSSGIHAQKKICNDQNCKFYKKAVSDMDKHTYKCNDSRCRDVGKYVMQKYRGLPVYGSHTHRYKCTQNGCRDINKFVVLVDDRLGKTMGNNHIHFLKCTDPNCISYNKYVEAYTLDMVPLRNYHKHTLKKIKIK